MKRRFNLKTFILTGTITIILTLLGTTNSKAVLQANPTTHASPAGKNGSTWITAIRQMETVGQTMGLSETLNGLNATSTSNKIDVHMILPTEYEAVAILSASGYGNPKKLREETNAQKRTTTGNSTGVYFTGDRWESVASYAAAGSAKYNHFSAGLYGITDLSTQSYVNGPAWCGWHGGSGEGQSLTRYDTWDVLSYAFGKNGLFSVGYGVKNGTFNPWDRCFQFERCNLLARNCRMWRRTINI